MMMHSAIYLPIRERELAFGELVQKMVVDRTTTKPIKKNKNKTNWKRRQKRNGRCFVDRRKSTQLKSIV